MKLNLRDCFWIIALIAMGLAWWLDHRHQAWRERNARNRIERVYRPADAEGWFLPDRIAWDDHQDRRDMNPAWYPGFDEAWAEGLKQAGLPPQPPPQGRKGQVMTFRFESHSP
jgi:hypothetical protein